MHSQTALQLTKFRICNYKFIIFFIFYALQVILPNDRTTIYDSLTFPVNKVFVFSSKISELQSVELEQMAVEFQGSIGVILVDV